MENRPFPVSALIWLAAALILTAVSPAELTLGSSVKLVFLHAALMWVGLIGYTASGIASGISLATRSSSRSAWADAALQVSTALLLSTGLLGILTAVLTWGGVLWREPRMLMLGKILALSAITLLGARLAKRPWPDIFRILLTVAVWYLLITTERIVHPVNPIFTSGNIAIMAFPLLITICLLAAANTVIGWLFRRRSAPEST